MLLLGLGLVGGEVLWVPEWSRIAEVYHELFWSFYLYLPSTGVTGMHHEAGLCSTEHLAKKSSNMLDKASTEQLSYIISPKYCLPTFVIHLASSSFQASYVHFLLSSGLGFWPVIPSQICWHGLFAWLTGLWACLGKQNYIWPQELLTCLAKV